MNSRATLGARVVDSDGEVRRFVPEKEWTPTPEDLASFKGYWFSEEAGGSVVWFTRDKDGKVSGMPVGSGRMRDMPFVRVK